MVLTVQHALQHIEHALLGRQGEEIHGRALINEAGESLIAYHPWKWLDRGDTQLLLRGKTEVDSSPVYFNAAGTRLTFPDPIAAFTVGETITQTGTGATGVVEINDATDDQLWMSAITGTFDGAQLCTGGTSLLTDTPNAFSSIAARSVVQLNAFTSYTQTAGDAMKITTLGDLTGVNRLQTFGVESKTDADSVVLVSPGLGASAADATANDGDGSWGGEIAIPYALLPTDFMELIAYDTTNSLVNSLELTTYQHLLELRTNQIEIAAWNFWGAISWFEDQTDSNRIKPRLELWPDPPVATVETLSIFYKVSWPRVITSDEEILIPEWMEPLYIHWLRAYARGYEDDADDQPGINQRLAAVVQGPIYMGAVDRDGRLQPEYGPLRGGAVQIQPSGHNRFLRTTVAGPS